MFRELMWVLMLSTGLVSRSFAAADAESSDLLRHALEDKNPDTRKEAVIALSLATNREPWVSRIEAMLEDKDIEVRQAVVASLAELNNSRSTAALRKALQDEVPEVSFAAAKALWQRQDAAGKQALLAVLDKESKSSSSFFTTQKRDALRMMHTPRTTFLFALRQGVGFVPVPGFGEGVASMQAILTDPGVSGGAPAALLLGSDKDPATLEALKGALSDKDWSVRAAAVHSVALRNNPALKQELEPLLSDDKQAVRLRAAAGYLRLSAIGSEPKRKRDPVKPGSRVR